ncbi:hypothetical protein KM043_006948 [Ampulex compressa]|nr:hypothetical protein KM043_006948 [Ampulex compressa]
MTFDIFSAILCGHLRPSKSLVILIIGNITGGCRLYFSKGNGSSRNSSWAKEAAEAERLEKMLKIENEENAATNDLALVIQKRNKERASQADSFFDSLIDKYAKKAEKPTKKKTAQAKATKKRRANT